MTIPTSTIESAIHKILRDEGWSIMTSQSQQGGVVGMCSQDIDGKVFAWSFSMDGMDMARSPMEIVSKIDGLRAEATSRMCSGIAI